MDIVGQGQDRTGKREIQDMMHATGCIFRAFFFYIPLHVVYDG